MIGWKGRHTVASYLLRALRLLRGYRVLFVFPLLLLSGCAGYQIGNQSLYPPEIHTVYVPMFEFEQLPPQPGRTADRSRGQRDRGQNAVTKSSATRTPTAFFPAASSEKPRDSWCPTSPATPAKAKSTCGSKSVGSTARAACSAPPVPFPAPRKSPSVTGTGDVVPEVGQSIATAQQQAICRLAEQIVGLMEKPW